MRQNENQGIGWQRFAAHQKTKNRTPIENAKDLAAPSTPACRTATIRKKMLATPVTTLQAEISAVFFSKNMYPTTAKYIPTNPWPIANQPIRLAASSYAEPARRRRIQGPESHTRATDIPIAPNDKYVFLTSWSRWFAPAVESWP